MEKEYFCHTEDVEEKSVGEGCTRKILSYSDNLMVCELAFKKGAKGSLHSHVHEQITYIVSGIFEFEVNGVKSTVKPGDTVYEPSGSIHGCICLEDGLLVDIFSPKREDFLS